jgi:BlaI family penicillinase repressor
VLWDLGPSTVRQVHDHLRTERDIGYTGVLKFLQNMLAKTLVRRNQELHTHIYEVRDSQKIRRQLLFDLMESAFGGSASQIVFHLLGAVSAKELNEIQRMIEAERRNQK